MWVSYESLACARRGITVPALQPFVRVAHFHAAIALAELAPLDATKRLEGAEGVFRSGWPVLERQRVVPEGHLRQRDAELSVECIALGCVGNGLGQCRNDPAVDVD